MPKDCQSGPPGMVRLTAGLGPPPARWYCVSNDGMATLCKDQEDAQASARHCDLAWPKGAPHRAVLLGDVTAERAAGAHAAGEYARKWWSRHSATNKHMTTTREAHEDFCALQRAILRA
jgi:hypothetical protein